LDNYYPVLVTDFSPWSHLNLTSKAQFFLGHCLFLPEVERIRKQVPKQTKHTFLSAFAVDSHQNDRNIKDCTPKHPRGLGGSREEQEECTQPTANEIFLLVQSGKKRKGRHTQNLPCSGPECSFTWALNNFGASVGCSLARRDWDTGICKWTKTLRQGQRSCMAGLWTGQAGHPLHISSILSASSHICLPSLTWGTVTK
jgi:hypothetical protein